MNFNTIVQHAVLLIPIISHVYQEGHACSSSTVTSKPEAAKSVFEEVTTHSLGSYTWLTLNETRVIPLENWQKEMHFCPYEPARGKWVLTCKKYLDRIVAQLSGEHIGKTINFGREGLSQLSWWKDSLLQCPENHYIMTCQFYWETAIEAMRTRFLESVYNLCKKFFHIT